MPTKDFGIQFGTLMTKVDVYPTSLHAIEAFLDNLIISEIIRYIKERTPTIAGGQILE